MPNWSATSMKRAYQAIGKPTATIDLNDGLVVTQAGMPSDSKHAPPHLLEVDQLTGLPAASNLASASSQASS